MLVLYRPTTDASVEKTSVLCLLVCFCLYPGASPSFFLLLDGDAFGVGACVHLLFQNASTEMSDIYARTEMDFVCDS